MHPQTGAKRDQIIKGNKVSVPTVLSCTVGLLVQTNVPAAYDEEDDGFTFTRKRPKKQILSVAQQPTIEEEKPRNEEKAVALKKHRKKSFSSPAPKAGAERDTKEKRRRSRQSQDSQDAQLPQINVKKRGDASDPSERKIESLDESSNGPLVNEVATRQEVDLDQEACANQAAFDATKIALPFADTPIIRRNKEMRKGMQSGSRRSSLGLRGRRASSLIDTGKSSGTSKLFKPTVKMLTLCSFTA